MRYDGPLRGSSKGQRHGHGHGGYKSTQRDGISSSFKSTRIEERASSDAEHLDGIPAHTIDPEDSSSGHSNDEEEHELNKAQIKPYNKLLQHLAATSQPQHKKRKLNQLEERGVVESSENEEDLEEEPGDLELLGADDLIDSGDEELGAEGGIFGPLHICERLD